MTSRGALIDVGIERAVALQRQAVLARRKGGWEPRVRDDHGEGWLHEGTGLTVIWSIDREHDGRLWLHASMAHSDRIPTWNELKAAKRWLVADDRYAYQVLPPAARYVNINPHVLHLWAVVEGSEPLPDFVREGGQL